jgi:hypothetical protein
MVAPIVLGLGGVALAANPTGLPSDQIAISGSCLSVSQVVAAGNQAMALYALGDEPAGVIVNGNWVPAAAVANSVALVSAGGCAGPALPTNSPLLPTDQITVALACPTSGQVIVAAQDAIALYVPGDLPAGVFVNGSWIPAGIAASSGGYLAGGCVA